VVAVVAVAATRLPLARLPMAVAQEVLAGLLAPQEPQTRVAAVVVPVGRPVLAVPVL